MTTRLRSSKHKIVKEVSEIKKEQTKTKKIEEELVNKSMMKSEKSDFNSNDIECEQIEDQNTYLEESEATENEQSSENYNNEQTNEQKVQIKFKNAQGDNKCKHCKAEFENPLMLLRHKREAHQFPQTLLPLEEIEKYYDYPNRSFCPICKKTLKTHNYKSIFLKHLHTHTVFRLFECVICKKKFRRKDHMLNHQKRHVVPIEDFIGGKKETETLI